MKRLLPVAIRLSPLKSPALHVGDHLHISAHVDHGAARRRTIITRGEGGGLPSGGCLRWISYACREFLLFWGYSLFVRLRSESGKGDPVNPLSGMVSYQMLSGLQVLALCGEEEIRFPGPLPPTAIPATFHVDGASVLGVPRVRLCSVWIMNPHRSLRLTAQSRSPSRLVRPTIAYK